MQTEQQGEKREQGRRARTKPLRATASTTEAMKLVLAERIDSSRSNVSPSRRSPAKFSALKDEISAVHFRFCAFSFSCSPMAFWLMPEVCVARKR